MDKTPKMSAQAYNALKGGGGKRPTTPTASPGVLYPTIRPSVWIGIDPGQFTGFAVWFARQPSAPSGRFLEVNTLTFWQTVRRLEKLVREFGPAVMRVRIEDPNGNRPLFGKGEEEARKREKMAQNVGANKRDAQLLIDLCKELQVPYDAIVPQARPTGTGKVGMEYFRGVQGFPDRCSQHARDASALVLGL